MDNNTDTSAQDAGETIRIPCEVYSRIVGYLRPVQNWHAGKQQEFADRVTFDLRKTVNDIQAGVDGVGAGNSLLSCQGRGACDCAPRRGEGDGEEARSGEDD